MLTIGEILKKERIKKNLSLNEIEKKTKIRKKYLEAIEENNWRIFPSKIYIEGVIKNYAMVLGLPYKKAIAFFNRDYEEKEEVGFKEKVSKNYFLPESKKIFTYFIIGFLLIIFIYFSWQLKKFLSPPSITFIAPKETHFITENQIDIKAKVDPETSVYIFSQRIYPDSNGYFKYSLPLKKGENEIIIKLTGANGKTAIIKKIFIKEK
ncbi:MAG: helix-turn-helix domain-containing protein [Microgenomates group bacterium]